MCIITLFFGIHSVLKRNTCNNQTNRKRHGCKKISLSDGMMGFKFCTLGGALVRAKAAATGAGFGTYLYILLHKLNISMCEFRLPLVIHEKSSRLNG